MSCMLDTLCKNKYILFLFDKKLFPDKECRVFFYMVTMLIYPGRLKRAKYNSYGLLSLALCRLFVQNSAQNILYFWKLETKIKFYH